MFLWVSSLPYCVQDLIFADFVQSTYGTGIIIHCINFGAALDSIITKDHFAGSLLSDTLIAPLAQHVTPMVLFNVIVAV